MRILNAMVLTVALAAFMPPGARAEDRALVIGINSYPGITLGGAPNHRNLKGAVIDARNFAAFLKRDYGFADAQVRLLIDEAATKTAIIESFESWLIAGTRPGDRALFYFAGHGAQIADLNGDEPEGDRFDEALAPSDTRGELALAPVKLSNLLIDDELGSLVERLKDRDLTVVVDACHAGTITRGLDLVLPEETEIGVRTLTPRSPAAATRGLLDLPDPVRRAHKVSTRLIEVEAKPESADSTRLAVWTATASSQLAFDSARGGVFTQLFLQGLREKAADRSGDGAVKAAELLTFVQEASEEICQARGAACRHGLTPTLQATAGYLDQVVFPLSGKALPAGESVAEKAEAQFAHANDFALKIEVLPTPRPKLGSEVRFRVTSAEPGKLLLLDKSPDGRFTQIFPNRFAIAHGKGGRIRSGAPLTLPDATYGFAFEATDRGASSLIALVVEEAAAVDDILARNLDLETLKDPEKLIAALAEQLRRPLETELDDQPNRRIRWAYATLDYVVE